MSGTPGSRPPPLRSLDSRTKLRRNNTTGSSRRYDTFRRADSTAPPMTRKMTRISKWSFGSLSMEHVVFACFWVFGTMVTMQFGVVVTASNDLVGTSAPPGLILFAYTLPSILVRMLVPYITFPDITISRLFRIGGDYSPVDGKKGTPGTPLTPPTYPGKKKKDAQQIDYPTRLTVCAASSFMGLQLLAWCDNVGIRIVGIALASLSSNLGDMSFFQLCTRFGPMINMSFGGYAAGSGAAGLIGAGFYTVLTNTFGVRPESVLSGVGLVPTLMLATYFLLLPSEAQVKAYSGRDDTDEDEEAENDEQESVMKDLKLGDKLELVTPMIWGYMAPLAIQMFLENITTQGILPTILWHLPLSDRFLKLAGTSSLFSMLFNTTRDFYPTFFTIYQTAIFVGRTSINIVRLPGGNRGSSTAYYALCITELMCFLTMLFQSLSMAYSPPPGYADADMLVRFSPVFIAVVIFAMGLCGGLGMSNTYWRVSKKPLPSAVWQALERATSKRTLARQEGVMTPMYPVENSNISDESEGEGDDEDYFFQRDRPRPRFRTAFSSRSAPGEGYDTMRMTPAGGAPSSKGKMAARPLKWSEKDETQVREFLVSTIALPDTVAIMVASIVSLWLQPKLCELQVEGGRALCRGG